MTSWIGRDRRRSWIRCLICAFSMLLTTSLQSVAQAPMPDFKSWIEQEIADPVARGEAAQASVSIIWQGQIVHLDGFGPREGPESPKTDPEADRFVIASITKTFTAMAVAQLVEDGTFSSLDAPANHYLKRIVLPEVDGRPITIAHLLAHTAGFEERGFGYTAHGLTPIPASSSYAQAAVPKLVRPPGEEIVYANIDPAILGAMIEDTTGLTLDRYIEERIFQPIGMRNTVLNYEMNGSRQLVVPWIENGSTIEPVDHKANAPFFAPTGSVEATAGDMGRYAQAMLGNGKVSQQILELLTKPIARNAEGLDAVGMAWFIRSWNEHSVIEHAGGFGEFSAWLILIPEFDCALFVSWTGSPSHSPAALGFGRIRNSFLQLILGDHIKPNFIPIADAQQPSEGTYWPERRPHSTSEVIFAITGTVDVRMEDSGLFIGNRGPYRPVASNLWAEDVSNGWPADMVAIGDGKIFKASDVLVYVSPVFGPQTLVPAFVLGLLLCLIGAFLPLSFREALAWSGPVLAVCALAVPLIVLWPNGLSGDFFSDLFAGKPTRFLALTTVATALLVATACLFTALVMRLATTRALPTGRLKTDLHIAATLCGGLLLSWIALQLNLFNPPSL